jgi:hypothetical protein
MTNLFGALDIGIWDFLDILCLGFEISDDFNSRDIISKDFSSIEDNTVKFHTRVEGLKPLLER